MRQQRGFTTCRFPSSSQGLDGNAALTPNSRRTDQCSSLLDTSNLPTAPTYLLESPVRVKVHPDCARVFQVGYSALLAAALPFGCFFLVAQKKHHSRSPSPFPLLAPPVISWLGTSSCPALASLPLFVGHSQIKPYALYFACLALSKCPYASHHKPSSSMFFIITTWPCHAVYRIKHCAHHPSQPP